jgi:uncharacterized membrane protein
MKKQIRTGLRRLIKYFVKGLLIVLPIAATLYVLTHVIGWIDSLINIGIPGLGLLIIITGISLVGYFGSWLITEPLISFIDDMISRVPGIKLIYTSIKDFIEAFVGDKRKFNEPVIVEMSEKGIYKMGFLTGKDLSRIGMQGYVGVYFPHSYNFSGNLFVVEAAKVKKLNTNATETMKFIISGGITEL